MAAREQKPVVDCPRKGCLGHFELNADGTIPWHKSMRNAWDDVEPCPLGPDGKGRPGRVYAEVANTEPQAAKKTATETRGKRRAA